MKLILEGRQKILSGFNIPTTEVTSPNKCNIESEEKKEIEIKTPEEKNNNNLKPKSKTKLKKRTFSKMRSQGFMHKINCANYLKQAKETIKK